MTRQTRMLALLSGLLSVALSTASAADSERSVSFGPHAPSILIRSAPVIAVPEAENPHRKTPFRVDNNAPSLWRGDQFILFHSWENIWRATGSGLSSLTSDQLTHFTNPKLDYLWYWLESAFDINKTIFGYYHNEVPDVCPPRKDVMAPGYPVIAKIGAVRSTDGGLTWEDLGWVMGGADTDVKCVSGSPWFAGGSGDFGVLPDRDGKFYYFYFANYSPNRAEQGLAVARLAAADLEHPVGKIQRWYQGSWNEPGLNGHSTPMWPSTADVYEPNTQIFWGPVIHWNTYLGKYVMVVNRTQDAAWATEGIYMSFSDDIANPASWSAPVKIMDRAEATRGDASKPHWNGWYASLQGEQRGETDKRMSQRARLFIDGVSRWEVEFRKEH